MVVAQDDRTPNTAFEKSPQRQSVSIFKLSARFDSNSVINRRPNPLLAAQVAFGRLNGDMPQKELDLFQLSSRGVAEPSAGPTKVMWRQLLQSDPLR